MAIFKPGGVGEVQAGSIGTVTVQGGPYGRVLHSKGRRVNTSSGVPTTHLERWYRAINAWRRLPRETRDAWDTWAETNEAPNARGVYGPTSGKQAFQSAAVAQWNVGGVGPVELPRGAALPEISSVGLAASATGPTFEVSFTPDPLPVTVVLLLWFAVFRAKGSTVPGAGWHGPIPTVGGLSSPFDIGAMLAGVMDVIQEGRLLGVRAAGYSTESYRVGRPLEARAVVVA